MSWIAGSRKFFSHRTQVLRFGASVVMVGTVLGAQSADRVFQGAMTSSGRNRPSINLAKDDLVTLSGLLHLRIPRSELVTRLRISDEELQRRLDLLVGEGLAKIAADNRVLPTSVVVTLEDARKYFRPDDRLVESAAQLIVKKLADVKARARALPSLAEVPFESMSFFLLSDVLLDNWQIGNVERLFVKAERTLRAGGRYYYTVLEKPAGDPTEPFGLYGNTGSQWGTVQVGLYGNDRFSGHTLLSVSDTSFNRMFGLPHSMSPKDARQQLADAMVQALRTGDNPLTPTARKALAQLSLMRNDRLTILLLREDDYQALEGVASVVTQDLIALLEQNRARILAVYQASPYAEETAESEFLLCWYHFFYAAVTNQLHDQGVLDIPANGTVTYFVVPR